MKQYLIYIKKFTHVSSIVLAGMFLFLAISAFGINKTILTPDFHKQLFKKNDIYSQTYNVIRNSMDGFIEGFKKHSPKDYEQHKDVFTLLEKSVTAEMVSSNLDIIREDAFKFFSGKRMFLPDIHLGSFAKYDPETKIKKEGDDKFSAETISKIEKVNLSAILLYINRNDIADQFVLIKLIYFILSSVPGILMLIFLFLMLVGVVTDKGISRLLKWIFRVFLLTGALSLVSGLALLIYDWFYLPANIRFLAMSLPIKTEAVISYARDCVTSIAFYHLACCTIFAVFSFLVWNVEKRLPWLVPWLFQRQLSAEPKAVKLRMIIRFSSLFIVMVCLVLSGSYWLFAFKSGYEANDFSAFIEKYKNANKVTQVISAKDDTIYALQVKLIEPESGIPLTNTKINISGSSNLLKKEFNETATTDYSGMAKFILDEGTFRLSFIQSDFPAAYQLPSPFLFDLKAAGTTIITVPINKAPVVEKIKWGVAEIEVLDKDNNPVPDLQLTLAEEVSAPGDPDSVFSITNSEGIAVFKLNKGDYSAVFTESVFPKKYIMPTPLNISITPGSITRYTIRLADVPPPSMPQKPANLMPRTNGTKPKKN